MFKFEELKHIHLEITNNCQASCPMCARNFHGGIENPLIKLESWTLDRYKTIINPEVLLQVETIYFCGNFGDPLLNNDLLDMILYSKTINENIHLRIHTNGSLRSKQWWKDLAVALPKKHKVIFAIDGLEDTHSIYRIGTSYSKIIENAKAFIDAGGDAEWTFIRFKHNEHQVDEAKRRAVELGFSEFTMKDSSRFFKDSKFAVYNKSKQPQYFLEPSQYSEIKFIDKKILDNYKQIVNETTVECYVLKQKEVYINAQGHLFPCCWLSSLPYQPDDEVAELLPFKIKILEQYQQLVNSLGGIEALNAELRTVKEIINSTEYQTVWINYWTENKLLTCVRACGVKPDVFSTPQDQFVSNESLKT